MSAPDCRLECDRTPLTGWLLTSQDRPQEGGRGNAPTEQQATLETRRTTSPVGLRLLPRFTLRETTSWGPTRAVLGVAGVSFGPFEGPRSALPGSFLQAVTQVSSPVAGAKDAAHQVHWASFHQDGRRCWRVARDKGLSCTSLILDTWNVW